MKMTKKMMLASISRNDLTTMRIVCETVRDPVAALVFFQRKYPFLFTVKNGKTVFSKPDIFYKQA